MKRWVRVMAVLMFVGLMFGLLSTGWAEEDSKDKININTATAEELTKLKGVGEVIAQKIIEYREQNGPFATVNDLLNVKGVGTKIFSDNVDMLTVGDSAAPPVDKAKTRPAEKTTKAK